MNNYRFSLHGENLKLVADIYDAIVSGELEVGK